MQIVPQGSYAQQLFDNNAGMGTDSAVTSAIMTAINNLLPPATNIPTGPDVTAVSVDHKPDTKSAIADVQKLFTNQPSGTSSLVLVGETHNDDRDKQRAVDFINTINSGQLSPTQVVFERGMTYPAPSSGNIIREENLTTVSGGNFGWALNARQRSMVVSGYLVLLHGGGNQHDINRDLLFYGAGHQDIFSFYDYFARHTSACYLLKEPRTFFNIRSYVPDEVGVNGN